ncbi:hypothetical protein [Jiangella sp. DSM 45060]|uniref:hypothetical protein n=1 Tax=Jiangella sp. DSM 45060 TaxID=1798224 RepID=UPI00087A2891|nr:hypothetical protein [Jiangella sp. DSM 45060]SDS95850.1 hypothetical protein SAMN04515669_2384 [Jiangella sp. DSM 45060]
MSEPLDLGVVGGGRDREPPDDEPGAESTARGRTPRWRRWAAVAAAFAIGGVAGLVVAQARDDAGGYAGVELYGGPAQPVFTGQRTRGELSVHLLNAGDHAVEILGVEIDGTPATETAEPVPADPGAWVTFVQRGLQVDCAGPLPTSLTVRARTASGDERLVELAPPDEYEGLRGFWYLECQGPFQNGLQLRDSTVLSNGDGAVVLRLELANTGLDDLRLGAVASRAPGFGLTTESEGLVVPAGQSAFLATTWTVTDCGPALGASGGSVAVRILHGDAETEQIIVLPDAGFTALARLSGQACPATIQE